MILKSLAAAAGAKGFDGAEYRWTPAELKILAEIKAALSRAETFFDTIPVEIPHAPSTATRN